MNNEIQDFLIQTKALYKSYPGPSGNIFALKNIDLQIKKGEFIGIVGKSGAGKTTLINMLAGLDSLTSGEVWINKEPIHMMSEDDLARWRGKNIGLIFQNFHLIPTLSLLDNVLLPLDFSGSLRKNSRQFAARLFSDVELSGHIKKLPSGISGGQRQRVAIVRALINNPVILLADEPTGRLDSTNAENIMNIFCKLVNEGITIVMVTHDFSVLSRFHKVYLLEDGIISSMTNI